MLISRVLSAGDRGDDAVALTDAEIEGDEGVVSGDFRNFIPFESGRSLCSGVANDGGSDTLWARGVRIDSSWEEGGVDESMMRNYVIRRG